MPWASALVEQAAVRELPEPVRATAAQRFEAPSRKATLPVGLVPVTVAVKVTDCPTVDGFADETSAVVVTDLTTCASALLVDAAFDALPP